MDKIRTLIPLFLLAFALPAVATEPGARLPDWYDIVLDAPDAGAVGGTVEVRATVAARGFPLAAVTLELEGDDLFACPDAAAAPFDLAPGATREVVFPVGCARAGSGYLSVRLECDLPREELRAAVLAMDLPESERAELLHAVDTVTDGPRFTTTRSVSIDVR